LGTQHSEPEVAHDVHGVALAFEEYESLHVTSPYNPSPAFPHVLGVQHSVPESWQVLQWMCVSAVCCELLQVTASPPFPVLSPHVLRKQLNERYRKGTFL
jgi:hypothetical protein